MKSLSVALLCLLGVYAFVGLIGPLLVALGFLVIPLVLLFLVLTTTDAGQSIGGGMKLVLLAVFSLIHYYMYLGLLGEMLGYDSGFLQIWLPFTEFTYQMPSVKFELSLYYLVWAAWGLSVLWAFKELREQGRVET